MEKTWVLMPKAREVKAGVASCSWVCRARGAQGLPSAWHEPASGTNQNLNPLPCFLLLSPVYIMTLCATTKHLRGNTSISLCRCSARPLLNTKGILSALAELRLGSRGAGADSDDHLSSPRCLRQDCYQPPVLEQTPLAEHGYSSPHCPCWDGITVIPISPYLTGPAREQVCGWKTTQASLKNHSILHPAPCPPYMASYRAWQAQPPNSDSCCHLEMMQIISRYGKEDPTMVTYPGKVLSCCPSFLCISHT